MCNYVESIFMLGVFKITATVARDSGNIHRGAQSRWITWLQAASKPDWVGASSPERQSSQTVFFSARKTGAFRGTYCIRTRRNAHRLSLWQHACSNSTASPEFFQHAPKCFVSLLLPHLSVISWKYVTCDKLFFPFFIFSLLVFDTKSGTIKKITLPLFFSL